MNRTYFNNKERVGLEKEKEVRYWLVSYTVIWYGFQVVDGMPSIPIYLRRANYEKIGRHVEATGKLVGKIINELIQQMS